MTDNPLIGLPRNTAPKSLDAYCQWLNGLEWVRQSGSAFTIAERDAPGGIRERYLSRGN